MVGLEIPNLIKTRIGSIHFDSVRIKADEEPLSLQECLEISCHFKEFFEMTALKDWSDFLPLYLWIYEIV